MMITSASFTERGCGHLMASDLDIYLNMVELKGACHREMKERTACTEQYHSMHFGGARVGFSRPASEA